MVSAEQGVAHGQAVLAQGRVFFQGLDQLGLEFLRRDAHGFHRHQAAFQPGILERQHGADHGHAEAGVFQKFGHGVVLQAAGANHEPALADDAGQFVPRHPGFGFAPVINGERPAVKPVDQVNQPPAVGVEIRKVQPRGYAGIAHQPRTGHGAEAGEIVLRRFRMQRNILLGNGKGIVQEAFRVGDRLGALAHFAQVNERRGQQRGGPEQGALEFVGNRPVGKHQPGRAFPGEKRRAPGADGDAIVIMEDVEGGVLREPKRGEPPVNGHHREILPLLEDGPEGVQLLGEQPLQDDMLISFPDVVAEFLNFARDGNIEVPGFDAALFEGAHHGLEHRLVLGIVGADPQTLLKAEVRKHGRKT